jgi:8-oxo-dGTP pyrophosphatase MutT (NUDIX family)
MSKNIGKFLVATGAIIENTNTGKILLLKRSEKKDFSGGIWEYITGRLNQFEEPEEGLRREIREEAGLEVEIVKLIRIYHIFRGEKTADNELVGIMYWCRTASEEIKLSEEHTDHMWISAEEALGMMEKPGMKKDIEAFIREKKI